MKLRLVAALAAAGVLAGCRAKEISAHDRALAAQDLSEAQFAVTLQDWPRAEELFSHAVGLVPDDGDAWMNLGITRMRRHNPGGAKSAYKTALDAYREAYRRSPEDSGPVLNEVTVLVLLNRADDARDVVNAALKQHPDDRRLRAFLDGKGIERIQARPGLKDLTP